MSGGLFSARAFTLIAGISYALAVYVDYPLFRYYPLVQRFSLHNLTDRALGPAMNWYGWIATASVIGFVVSFLVPKRWGDRLPATIFWVLPFIMLVVGWYHERAWFQAVR